MVTLLHLPEFYLIVLLHGAKLVVAIFLLYQLLAKVFGTYDVFGVEFLSDLLAHVSSEQVVFLQQLRLHSQQNCSTHFGQDTDGLWRVSASLFQL